MTSHFAKDFSRTTVAALRKRGISIVGATFVPGPTGSYCDGERAYCLDDNGTHRVRSYMQVRAIAAGESV